MALHDFQSSYINVREDGDIVIVTFQNSRITEDDNIQELGHSLFSLVDQYGFRKIVLDLTGVDYVTSAVIGKMITLHRRLHRNEGMLVLCSIGSGVGTVLHTSRLIDYFNTANDTEAAVSMLGQSVRS